MAAIMAPPDMIVSGTSEDVPTTPVFAAWAQNIHVNWFWATEETPFKGMCFLVRRGVREPSPAATLAVLSALAQEREATLPYYDDSPEAAERQAHLTAAIYANQIETIAQLDG